MTFIGKGIRLVATYVNKLVVYYICWSLVDSSYHNSLLFGMWSQAEQMQYEPM